MWQLVINGPGYFDTSYDLPEGDTSLGRADENDIVLSGDMVSRQHARLRVQNGRVEVEDLESRNGTKVNGLAVEAAIALKPGDTITVGENTLLIRQPEASEDVRTEVVDISTGGVRRFGQGVDIAREVVLSRGVKESSLMRALDNVAPFEPTQPPLDMNALAVEKGSLPIRYESLLFLYKVSEALHAATSLTRFLDDTVDKLMQAVNATTAVVMLRHLSGALAPATVRHRGKLTEGEAPVSDAVIEAALEQGAALAVRNVRDDSRFASRESVVMYGVDQVLCVPIGARPPFVGVLYLNRAAQREGKDQLEKTLELCTEVGRLLFHAVERFSSEQPTAGDGRLREVLERFHAPNIVERRLVEMRQLGDVPVTVLEKREVTVLLADLAGFTAFAQRASPERVTALLNEFYKRMTSIVFSFEGTVDKFVGDAMMAMFGAPWARGNDALRAVRAALALRAEWARAMAERPEAEQLELKLALCTGPVLVGTVGSPARLDYTAFGETVNLTSWLASAAQPGQILVTKPTLMATGGKFEVVPRGERMLGGRTSPVPVFEVVEEDAGHVTDPGSKSS